MLYVLAKFTPSPAGVGKRKTIATKQLIEIKNIFNFLKINEAINNEKTKAKDLKLRIENAKENLDKSLQKAVMAKKG